MSTLLLALLCLFQEGGDEAGYTPLCNGKDFTGFSFVFSGKDADPSKTFSIADGVIVNTGNPAGYMITEKSYKDFVLRFDWRYKRPEKLEKDADFTGNSGYLLFVTGERKIWPKALEIQGMNRDAGKVIPITIKAEYTVDQEAQKKAVKPVGEWNTMEIVSKSGIVTSVVNGVKIATVTSCELKEGPIAFQSEGAEIHWRNLRIKAEP
jgi:hypothetical protein